MEIETPISAIRTVVETIVHRPMPTPKRKRSESPPLSPRRHARRALLPPTIPAIDPERALERARQIEERLAQQDKEKQEKKSFDPKAEYERLLNSRSGGVYVPPARLRALQAQFTDKNTKEYQRMAWEALKKSINGLINKVRCRFLSNAYLAGQHFQYQDDCS